MTKNRWVCVGGVVALVTVIGCASLRPIDRDLLSATTTGDRVRAESALQSGANVNASDENGWTPLLLAARAGDVALVQDLVRRGADVNAANSTGETALMLCHPRVVQVLVDAGASFSARGGMFDETALMMASDVEKTRALLAAGAPVDARNSAGDTALWFALLRGQGERAKVLLAAGADVDASGSNPLLVAAHFADAEMMRMLLNAGADPNARDLFGRTPLHWAATNLRRGVLEAVLAARPDVNAQALDGRTPLMVAVQDGYTDNARALLAAGADPSIRSAAGQSPLEWAQARSNAELVTLLQSRGAESPGQPMALAELKKGRREGGLSVSTTDITTDGRFAHIRGLVRNHYQEPVEGVRYEVVLMSGDRARALDTLRYETDTTIAPGDEVPLKIDAESMYFGSGGSVLLRALPKKVGGRELQPPPGWRTHE